MRLTGGQHKQFQQALSSAFPTRSALAQMVRHQLDQDLEQIAGGDKLDDIAFSLISWAEAGGRIEELIEKARNENPGNPDLKVFFEQFQHAQRELGASLESPILSALQEHHNSHADSPGMTLGELYNAIGVSPNDSKKVGLVHRDLFSLKNKGCVKSQILADGSSIVTITPEGMRVAQDRCQPAPPMLLPEASEPPQEPSSKGTANETGGPKPCPTTFDDLIQGRACACSVQRDDILREIKERFTRILGRHHFIVLHGQPMVGKTKILKRISETLSNEYVPLEVTGQGLVTSAVNSLDAFLQDLTDQLTTKFGEWAKNRGVSVGLHRPDQIAFQGGHGSTVFRKYWSALRRSAGKRMPIVMFDEIEHLLDHLNELSPQILTFLDDFVRKPENGYFIMVGSEQIQHSSHRQFSNLIARGHSIQVRYYDDTTVASVFDIFQEYFVVDRPVLQCLSGFCDGHPRILPYVYEAAKSIGKQKLDTGDVEPILTAVIDQTDDILWALWQRLSLDERHIVWLISQTMSDPVDGLRRSVYRLPDLAGGTSLSTSVDDESLRRGVTHLAGRQWTEWKNSMEGLFRFRLGIVPFWVRYKDISPG